MALTLQIICNPYIKRITYRDGPVEDCQELHAENPLLEYDKTEFSYIVTDIVEEVYKQGYERIIFAGSDDDYEELEYAVKTVPLLEERFKGKEELKCKRSEKRIINARNALGLIESEFKKLQEIVEKKYSKQDDIRNKIKFSEIVSDEIPIVIIGAYSSGKSAFINALIGAEVLPSATTTTTAKTHRIRKSASAGVGKILFRYDEEDVVIRFEDSNVIDMSDESEFCEKLYTSIRNNSKDNTIESHIYQALKQLNEQDIKDSRNGKKSHFSDLIEVEIPSEKGIFSEKKFNYSILDTPGSDSADKGSGRSHFEILKQALRNQTNGLPICVTVPESMNSAENKKLLAELDGINLDRNNSIVIANKAELSSVEGLKKLSNEDDVIREWQSTRIYFVSSIAGLAGQKGSEDFYNDEYKQPFKMYREYFINRSDPDYRQLYTFSIMPSRRKKEIEKNCQEAVNSEDGKKILFANSGMQCVVEEVLDYGEKHALYDKCTKAIKFLSNIIDDIENEINDKKSVIESNKSGASNKFEQKKAEKKSALKDKGELKTDKILGEYRGELIDNVDYTNKKNFKKEWQKYEKSLKRERNKFHLKQDTDQVKIKDVLTEWRWEEFKKHIQNIVDFFYRESKAYFERQEASLIRYYLCYLDGDKKSDLSALTDAEIRDKYITKDSPKLEEIEDDIFLERVKITSGFFKKKLNFKKLQKALSERRKEEVDKKIEKVGQSFKNWFKDLNNNIINNLGDEMVSHVPDLKSLSEIIDQYESALEDLENDKGEIKEIKKRLDKVIEFQEKKLI